MKKLVIQDSVLRELLLNPQLNNRKQYVCDCPFCGKEHHFYISKQTQMWDCKKCGESGNVYKLLKQLGKTFLLEGATVEEKDKIQSIRSILKDEIENDQFEIKELPIIKMPVGWKVCNNGTNYLSKRHVTPKDCKRYMIGMTDLYRKYNNYVLIPIFDNKKIRGYVGRYADKKVPEGKLRYNNSAGTEFSELLFGYDDIICDVTQTVILVEGIFDKISVDKYLDLYNCNEIKCVCTFGKKISNVQIQKLLLKSVINVVLLYDFDALKDTQHYASVLEKYFSTTITFTNKKDIDECTREEALQVFSKSYKPSEFNVDVIAKVKRK